MSCQCLKARRFQTQPLQLASPKALQVLATDEAAPCTTACSLEQLLLLEPDSATPELISFFSLAAGFTLPAAAWLCPSHLGGSWGWLATSATGDLGFSILKMKCPRGLCSHCDPVHSLKTWIWSCFIFKGKWDVSVVEHFPTIFKDPVSSPSTMG